eukprot:scaffold74286_cov15-Tisochrysis_lutea.AAC.1
MGAVSALAHNSRPGWWMTGVIGYGPPYPAAKEQKVLLRLGASRPVQSSPAAHEQGAPQAWVYPF